MTPANDATFRTAVRLSSVTASIALVAAVWTFADPGLLHGPEAMQGSARGTALVLGTVAVPMLLAALRTAWRGSGAALLVSAGALLYVLYNSVLFLFLTPFNAAFLVYVALLGSALWSVGHLAATREVWRVGRSVADRAPVRGIALYVWVVAGLNAAAWLAMVVPSLGSYPTPMLAGTGVQTNAIYVQDLAVWLPLAAVAALWLRRREARGAVVVAAVLGLWVIEGVSVAVDQWFGAHADPSSEVVSLTLVAPFLALAAVGLVPLWRLLRTSTPVPRDEHLATGADADHGDSGRGDDDLAEGAPLTDVRKRLRDIIEAEGAVDVDRDLAGDAHRCERSSARTDPPTNRYRPHRASARR